MVTPQKLCGPFSTVFPIALIKDSLAETSRSALTSTRSENPFCIGCVLLLEKKFFEHQKYIGNPDRRSFSAVSKLTVSTPGPSLASATGWELAARREKLLCDVSSLVSRGVHNSFSRKSGLLVDLKHEDESLDGFHFGNAQHDYYQRDVKMKVDVWPVFRASQSLNELVMTEAIQDPQQWHWWDSARWQTLLLDSKLPKCCFPWIFWL
jgi:hypothetical protein